LRHITEKFFPNNFLDQFFTSAPSTLAGTPSALAQKNMALKLSEKLGTGEKDDLLALRDKTNVICHHLLFCRLMH